MIQQTKRIKHIHQPVWIQIIKYKWTKEWVPPPTNPTKAKYSGRPNQFLSKQKEKGQGWQIECKSAKSWHLQLTSLLLSSKKENWYHKRKLLSRLILIFWHSRWAFLRTWTFYNIFYLLIYRRQPFILLKLIYLNSQLLSVTRSNLGYGFSQVKIWRQWQGKHIIGNIWLWRF